MKKQLATLTVHYNVDEDDLLKALEDAGFTIIKTDKGGFLDTEYIIAEETEE